MSVTARNPLELVPIGLAFASAALLFGLPSELSESSVFWLGWYTPALLGSIVALAAILFGFRYVKLKGRNPVVWVGVLISIFLLTLNLAFLLNFRIWQSVGF